MDKELRRMAKELDRMPRDVSPEEADVLERVLEAFSDGKKPKNADAEEVKKMYDRYLGSPRDEEKADEIEVSEEDLDGE